jgi:hypothetical protein
VNRGPLYLMDRLRGFGRTSKFDREIFRIERRLDAKRLCRSESKIDVIPKDRRIASALGERSGYHLSVSVSFDDLAVGLQRGVVKRVRELAQTAADIRDDASFAQFPALDKPAKLARASDLLPEAKRLAGGDLESVKLFDRDAKIVDLTGDEEPFARVVLGP